ncbi:MAG: protein kinase domain-containing protein [Cyanobacteriota bacterium]
MSQCINPSCPDSENLQNPNLESCPHCGTPLWLQRRYRVLQLLRDSNLSKTYEVDDLGIPKVLKVLQLNNPKAIALFQQEAKVLSQISHPGIPTVERSGYFTVLAPNSRENLHCLVMEKIEGETLAQWHSRRNHEPISHERAIHWLKQLVEILQKLHEQLYFHGDIQPSHILLRKNGQLALINFAMTREVTLTYLARFARAAEATKILSPGYTPSEQAQGQTVPQSDFFALGRTFVYLLTGKSPNHFAEDPRTGELLWQHRSSQVSPSLIELIDYLMAPFSGHRPHKAQIILQLLKTVEPTWTPLSPSKQALDCIDETEHLSPLLDQIPPWNSPTASSRNWMGKGFKQVKDWVITHRPYLLMGGLLFSAGVMATQVYDEIGRFSPSLIEQAEKTDSFSIPLGNKFPFDHKVLSNVTAIAFNPVEGTFVSGGQDGKIKVWDRQSGHSFREFSGQGKGIEAIAFSPMGNLLATVSEDHTIQLWDYIRGELLHELSGHGDRILNLTFNREGNTLASSSDDATIQLWDTTTGERLRAFESGSDRVVALQFSPNSETLTSLDLRPSIAHWNIAVGKAQRELIANRQKVSTLAISPNGKFLASVNATGKIDLWNLTTGQQQTTFDGHPNGACCLAISPDSQILVSGSQAGDNTIRLWNLSNGTRRVTRKAKSNQLRSLSFSPDGKTLAIVSVDNTLELLPLP